MIRHRHGEEEASCPLLNTFTSRQNAPNGRHLFLVRKLLQFEFQGVHLTISQRYPNWDPLIGPPSHWSPISLVPFSLVPQLIGPPIHYWSSLVPHLIGPPYHWSPISLVPLFIRHPTIGQSQWSPISLVPHLIGSPSHWSAISLVRHLIGPPISTHASAIPLVPHLICPPDSLVPHLIGPPM